MVIFYMIVLYMSLFLTWLSQFLPQMDIIGALIGPLFIIFALFKMIYQERQQKTLRPIDIGALLLFIIFIVYTMIPNLFYQPRGTFRMQFYSLYSLMKIWIIFWCGLYVFKDIDFTATTKFVRFFSGGLTTIFLILGTMNLKFHFFPAFDKRFGFDTIAFGFKHPAQFAATVVTITLIHTLILWIEEKRLPYAILLGNFVLVFFAGRTISITFYVVLLLLLIFVSIFKKLPPISVYFILGGLSWLLARERILDQFFGSATEARGILLGKSIQIAQDYAPFGAGLAMFGSQASRLNYSPLYDFYGISRIWGLSRSNPAFVTDSYLAMIIGELGYIGVILVLFLIGYFLRLLYQEVKEFDYATKLLIFLPLMYALFTGLADAALVSNTGVFLVLGTIYMVALRRGYAKQRTLDYDREEGQAVKETFNLQQLVDVVKKRMGLILIVAFLTTLLGAGYAFFMMTPEYKATVQVIVNQNSNNENLRSMEVQADVQLVNTYNSILKSPFVLESVSEKLEKKYSVVELMNKIQVSNEMNSQVINVSVVDENSQVATKIATAVAESFRDKLSEIMKSSKVTILSTSQYNTVSTTKKPIFYVLIALVLGLVIGFVFALIAFWLDSTVKTEEDIEEELNIKVLGTISSVKKN